MIGERLDGGDASPSGSLAYAIVVSGIELSQVKKARLQFALGCPDWTERRPHLGGALGAAILAALQHQGHIRRQPDSRSLTLVQPIAN
jgi:hypothetical protein